MSKEKEVKISKKNEKLLHEFYNQLESGLKKEYGERVDQDDVIHGFMRLNNDDFFKYTPLMGSGFVTEKSASYYGLTVKGKTLLEKWTQEMYHLRED